MNKLNITKIFASCACCFLFGALGALKQPQILPDISPSLQVLNNFFSSGLSEPAALVLSGIGLIWIASAARQRVHH